MCCLPLSAFYKTEKNEVAIHGHTDSAGNDEANLLLSTQRAQSVYDFLIAMVLLRSLKL